MFPLVLGSDCSILLGCLAGARQHGLVCLLHIDGHADFRDPGNHDFSTQLGFVAGMDLALATGRGEALMTDWPEISSPLVPDASVLQLGERESRNYDCEWPDHFETEINVIDIFTALEIGPKAVLAEISKTLEKSGNNPVWIHLDVDVLDQQAMPAVDSPGSPGLSVAFLVDICRETLAAHSVLGMSFSVFDPD